MALVENITDLVGGTPLLHLKRLPKELNARILVKLEAQNPSFSVKDRGALAMINDAEAKGLLKPGATIVEPTSGNMGIALASIGAARGYKVILTMPDTFSIERRKLLKALGAQLVLTPGNEGMKGAEEKARQIAKEEKAFLPGQFGNLANVDSHYRTTGPEIWKDTDGKVDVFVSGVGSGGTVTGVGRFLKEKNPQVHIVAVEPSGSPVLSGGRPGQHKIQGLGAGFIPAIYDNRVVDEVIRVGHEDAGKLTRRLALEEGVLAGISTGANLWAALELAKRPEFRNKTIVTVACDIGERYLSTWLFEDN